jgi:RNA polymerase sigma-70 factor (ECF subfamily)
MATFGHMKASRRDELNELLPKLYKFAVVLSAHEQLSRALVRGTLKALGGDLSGRKGWSNADFHALKQMYALWAIKVAETPSLRQNCAPEPRLFVSVQSGTLATAHFAKFIANLSSQQRAALYLVYGEGASYDEAAEIMGLDILALMKALSRGHAALAHWLEHRGIDHTMPGRGVDNTSSARMAEYAA